MVATFSQHYYCSAQLQLVLLLVLVASSPSRWPLASKRMSWTLRRICIVGQCGSRTLCTWLREARTFRYSFSCAIPLAKFLSHNHGIASLGGTAEFQALRTLSIVLLHMQVDFFQL